MEKWFCERCDYMLERQYTGGLSICPFCDTIMYPLEIIIQDNVDWENYPTVSC